jgi:acetyl-CoA carboxylase biotin carboxylase subunit
LKRALREIEVGDLKTTKPLFAALADDGDVVAANLHTGWLESWLETNASRLV